MKIINDKLAKVHSINLRGTAQVVQKTSNSLPQTVSFKGLEAMANYNCLLAGTSALKEDKSAYKIISGLKLYSEHNPNNDAARARMFTPNHELPEDWLEAYELDYELDFDTPFGKTNETYGEVFKTLKEYAEYKSDPIRLRNIQLKKLKEKVPPAQEEHILYRGLGPTVPKEVISMLETAEKGDTVIPDWGVACVTPSPDYAAKHYSDGALLRIKTPVGARLAGLYKDGYAEFHMPAMAEYKYLGSCKINGLTVYDLEYIIPDLSAV